MDPNLIKECIEEARRERMSRGPDKEIHVVICKTHEQGKKFMTNHKCSRCWHEVKYYSTSNSLRGMLFNDVEAIHVIHYDPILWRDLGMCLAASHDFDGPIYTHL